MYEGDEFELGDSWYKSNVTQFGRAYLFIKSTDNGGKVSLKVGFKPLFSKLVIYISIAAASVIVIGCLIICCWYVRRKAQQKGEEGAPATTTTKVKKYSNKKEEDKISKFKYGRQSAPIQLPELADNGDDMQKPQDDGYDYSADK